MPAPDAPDLAAIMLRRGSYYLVSNPSSKRPIAEHIISEDVSALLTYARALEVRNAQLTAALAFIWLGLDMDKIAVGPQMARVIAQDRAALQAAGPEAPEGSP